MLVFDIETNGLLEDVSVVHCMCIYDTDTKVMTRYTPDEVDKGVEALKKTIVMNVTICGHNIISYDIPVLEKLYGEIVPREKRPQVLDTLVLSRLIYSDITSKDIVLMRKGKLPSVLFGSHKLEAWGYRLGVLKGDYGQQEDAWAVYTDEMLDYNEQDVVVTTKLLEHLESREYAKRAIELEHQIAWLMAKQERNGFPFDVFKAQELEVELRSKQATIESKLVSKIPTVPDRVFIPKRDNKRLGYKAGVPVQKYKDFNPNSRQQIEYVVRHVYHYEPNNYDLYDIPDGVEDMDLSKYRLKVDEETFKFIANDTDAPEELRQLADLINDSLLLKKRLGQLADGKNAWLSMVGADGRIHGRVIPNGAVSGRATHSSPNVAQVPNSGSKYGPECRRLFNSGDWCQAGIDASGLELRCLAHFMSRWDNGEYAHEILNGDIHTANQKAAGLETRNNAKTFN